VAFGDAAGGLVYRYEAGVRGVLDGLTVQRDLCCVVTGSAGYLIGTISSVL
jgi:hypothetical protein